MFSLIFLNVTAAILICQSNPLVIELYFNAKSVCFVLVKEHGRQSCDTSLALNLRSTS